MLPVRLASIACARRASVPPSMHGMHQLPGTVPQRQEEQHSSGQQHDRDPAHAGSVPTDAPRMARRASSSREEATLKERRPLGRKYGTAVIRPARSPHSDSGILPASAMIEVMSRNTAGCPSRKHAPADGSSRPAGWHGPGLASCAPARACSAFRMRTPEDSCHDEQDHRSASQDHPAGLVHRSAREPSREGS